MLASGLLLPDRLAKTAMTEGLAEKGRPGLEIETVYRRWAASGVGLLITGNVMIDRDHLERPGNVVIDRLPDADMRARLKRWAEAAKSSGGKVIMQVSHAGRQTSVRVNKHPKAPSAVRVNLPGRQFGDPVALTESTPLSIDLASPLRLCARAALTGCRSTPRMAISFPSS